MASIYEKARSPFWYIQYTDSEGVRKNKSTGLRVGHPSDTVKARTLRAEMEAKELARAGAAITSTPWESWVPSFLKNHCESDKTLVRYTTAWGWLSLWLQEKRLNSPRAITYGNATGYLEWRTAYKKKSGKSVGQNTAILELKIFAMIMAEAVRRGHTDANPLVALKLKRDKSAKKPEMSNDEVVTIRKALKEELEWMQTAFEISLHTGCRLRETKIPLSCVNLEQNKMTFPSPKGGEERAFSIAIPSALRPMLESMKAEKREFTLELPFQPSRDWQQFFKKVGMPHLCFHCIRVTFVNRLFRAGVPREVAMRMVNHASELVHKIYQREKVEDVAQYRDSVTFPEA